MRAIFKMQIRKPSKQGFHKTVSKNRKKFFKNVKKKIKKPFRSLKNFPDVTTEDERGKRTGKQAAENISEKFSRFPKEKLWCKQRISERKNGKGKF